MHCQENQRWGRKTFLAALSSLPASPGIIHQKNAEIEQQRKIAQLWIDNNQQDYAAHAILQGGLPSIIEDGFVRPDEDLFRQKGEVNRRTYGHRWTKKLPTLSEEDLKQLDELDDEDQKVLEGMLFLQSKDPLLPKEHQELHKLDLTAFGGKDQLKPLTELQTKLYWAALKEGLVGSH